MTARNVFGPRWVYHTDDTSEDDYRFLSRWGKEDRTLSSGTNSLPHSFIHSLTHSISFKYILRTHSRRHFIKYYGDYQFSRTKRTTKGKQKREVKTWDEN